MLRATEFAQFPVFLVKNRAKRLYFDILGAPCQSVSQDKDSKKGNEETNEQVAPEQMGLS